MKSEVDSEEVTEPLVPSISSSKTSSASIASYIPSPKFTFRKFILTVAFGLGCFILGHSSVVLVNRLSNRVRQAVGLPVYYYYDAQIVTPDRTVTYPLNPDPWIREVADLLGEFYELINRMGFWPNDPSPIAYPPHEKEPIDIAIASKLGLETQIVDLMQLMPYVVGQPEWVHGINFNTFLLGGGFVDYRVPWQLKESRDPFSTGVDHTNPNLSYDAEDGKYMQPYYLALTSQGDSGVVMILDTRTHNLWLIDWDSRRNMDPGIPYELSYAQHESANMFAFDTIPARPAIDVLKDCMAMFRNLDWLPGGIGNGSWEYDVYKQLYIDHGWPSESFNATAFDQARGKAENDRMRQRNREEPIEQLETLKKWREMADACNVQCKIDRLNKDWEDPEYKNQFADPDAWKENYEDQLKWLMREKELEGERRRLDDKQMELLEKEIADMPEEVKKTREERIKKYGF